MCDRWVSSRRYRKPQAASSDNTATASEKDSIEKGGANGVPDAE